MGPISPLKVAPYQIEAPSLSYTFPTTTLFGATNSPYKYNLSKYARHSKYLWIKDINITLKRPGRTPDAERFLKEGTSLSSDVYGCWI